VFSEWIATIFTLNLGVSVAAVVPWRDHKSVQRTRRGLDTIAVS
jgi:hypothetical protein